MTSIKGLAPGVRTLLLGQIALVMTTMACAVYLAVEQATGRTTDLLLLVVSIEVATIAACVLVLLRVYAWLRHASRWPLVAADIMLGLVVGYVMIPLALTDGLPFLVAALLLSWASPTVAAVGRLPGGTREGATSAITSLVLAVVGLAAAVAASARLYA